MPEIAEKNFSDDAICKVLLKTGLISETQNKEIFVKKKQVRSKIQQIRAKRSSSAGTKGKFRNPVTIVDVITALKMDRADDSDKPLDEETIIKSVMKTGKALIVHEACKTGGYGGEVAAVIAGSEAFDYLEAPVKRLAGRDIPIPYNRHLEQHSVPQVESIIEASREMVVGG